MKRSLIDTFVLPNLALLEAAGAGALPQGEVRNFTPVRYQADVLEANQHEVIRADALGADGNHALVVAKPGMGKTTLLRYLAYSKAQNESYFPIFVSLKTWRSGYEDKEESLISLAFREGVARATNLTWQDIEQLTRDVYGFAARGRVALFLDGLDQMDRTERDRLCRLISEFLSSSMSNNSLVVTTRPDASVAMRLSALNRYEILPFNLQQTKSLLQKCLPDKAVAAGLIHRIVETQTLQALAGVPYLIVLFAKVAERMADDALLSSNPLLWYQHVIDYMLRDTPNSEAVLRVLESLAFKSIVNASSNQSRGLDGFSKSEVEELVTIFGTGNQTAAEVARTVLDSSLIMRRDTNSFEFVHRSLEEYLAASAISRIKNPLEVIRRKVFDADLSDPQVLLMAIARLRKPNRAYRLLEALPDSVDFRILRMRALGLRYNMGLHLDHVERLAQDLENLIINVEACTLGTLTRIAGELSGADRYATPIIRRFEMRFQDPNVEVRRRAVIALGAMRSPFVYDALKRALEDSDREIQEEAARALGNTNDSRCVGVLRDAYLYSKGSLVFDAAIEALVKIGGPHAVSALIAILNDRSLVRNLRWPAARALGEIGDPSAYDALVNALSDEAESVRENAAYALGALRDSRAGTFLCHLLKDSEAGVRIAAAEALGLLRDQNASGDLLEALCDSHPVVRESVARALMQIDKAGLSNKLAQVIREQTVTWRGQAANLFAEVTGEEALPLLLLLIKDREGETRVGAASGLVNITNEDADSALLTLLEDPSPDVRRIAADGLGGRQYKAAVPILIRCLETEDNDLVSIEVASALGNIGDRQAVDPLIRMLQKGGAVPYYSALALGMIGDEQAIPPLVAMCRRTQENEWFRSWPMHAIGRIGGRVAAESLNELLQTFDTRGRYLLAGVLKAIEDPTAVFGLLLCVADEDTMVRASAREGLRTLSRPTLETGLRKALQHPDPRVRLKALEIIPFYADELAKETLSALALSDEDPQVMSAAAEALKAYHRKFEPPPTE